MTSPAAPDARPAWLFRGSGTTSAFLLLVSVVFAVPAAGFATFNLSGGNPPGYAAAYERCTLAQIAGHWRVPPRELPQCRAYYHLAPHSAFWASFGLSFVIMCAAAAAQYWLGPAWRIRRRRLRPVDPRTFPGLSAELRRLTRQALGEQGEARVRFVLDILNPAIDGLAFGRANRRYIMLSRGLVDLHDREPELFRAVALHELAHIRNRDLDLTAITLALWRSFVVVILVPGMLIAVIGAVFALPPGTTAPGQVPFVSGAGLSWLRAAQLTGTAGLGWLCRYTVLRARELYADARVLSWQGGAGPLRRLFAAAGETRRWRARDLWRRWRMLRRRTHPHLRVRRFALSSTEPLLRQGFAFSFALAACFSLAMDPATSLTAALRTDQYYWPAEAVVLLLMAALGIRALRAPPGSLRVPAALALGFPAGTVLAPSMLTDHAIMPFPESLQLAGLAVLALAGWLLGTWVEWVARAWAPRIRASARPARTAIAPVALIVVVVLISARAVYRIRVDTVFAYVDRYPAAGNPLVQVLETGQFILDNHAAGPVWLPAAIVLLLAIPLTARLSSVPFRPRRRGGWRPAGGRRAVLSAVAVVLVLGCLALAAGIAAATPVNEALLRLPAGSPAVEKLDAAWGCGAGIGAAVAARARAAPVVTAVLVALAAGLAYTVATQLRWPGMTLLLTNLLETAVAAALLVSAITQLPRLHSSRMISR